MVPFNFSLPPPSSSSSSCHSAKTHWRLSSLVATTLLLSLAPLLVLFTVAWRKQANCSPLFSLPSSSPLNGGVLALGPSIDSAPTPITALNPVSASSNHLASKAKRRDKLERLELGLARTRSVIWSIKQANYTSIIPPNPYYIPRGPASRNPYTFN